MPSESGDMKLLGNFRKLIDFVSADPNYNPANSRIKIAGLETLYTSGQTAATNVRTTEAELGYVRQRTDECSFGLIEPHRICLQ